MSFWPQFTMASRRRRPVRFCIQSLGRGFQYRSHRLGTIGSILNCMNALFLASVLAPNGAAYFDGDAVGRVIGGAEAIQFNREFTLEAWVKLDAKGVNRTFQPIFYKSVDGAGFELTVLNRPHHQIHTTDFHMHHRLKPVLPVDEWVHLAYARSHKKACLYLNGKLALETPTQAPLKNNSSEFYIGASQWSDQEGKPVKLIGAIDEVKIWSVARSGKNIRRTRFTAPPLRNRALMAYYPIDEKYGFTQPNLRSKEFALEFSGVGWVPDRRHSR
jgi:hypothetical protein